MEINETEKEESLSTLTQKPLAIQSKDVTDRIVQETDPDKLKDLAYLFHLTQVKKETIRVDKLNDLQDKIAELIARRVDKAPDNFTNMELIQYLQAVQTSKEKSIQQVDYINNPAPVQLTQQNIQVNLNKDFDRASRERILAAVNAILNSTEEIPTDMLQPIETQAEEVNEIVTEENSEQSYNNETQDNI